MRKCGRSCKLFPAAPLRQFPGAPPSLRESDGFKKMDETCGGDVEEELVLELDGSPGTTKGTSSQSCTGCSSIFVWSKCGFFDHWHTHTCIRSLRRAHLLKGRQACHRAIALSRDEDREHLLMLPRSFALLHWPKPPLWGSWN